MPVDPILMYEETHERCDWHVCSTLTTLLAVKPRPSMIAALRPRCS